MRWIVLVASVAGCDDPPDRAPETTPSTGTAVDDDADGYAVPADCDDTDADVHPGAEERCNTIDEDCDGHVDNHPVDGEPGFVDADGDGIGNEALPVLGCDADPEWAVIGGDCNDHDAEVHPGVTEICNGKDDDCDYVTDDLVLLDGRDHPSIQEAVLAADAGAVIELCDRTYVEGGILVDRDVTIRSLSGAPASATVDGSVVDAPVFLVDGGDLTLEGLDVRWGTGLETVFDFPNVDLGIGLAGGGVHALTGEGGAVTVRSCVFEDNVGDVGGAIAAVQLVVEDSTFLANSVTEVSGWGGALWIAPGGSLTVERSLFQENSAGNGGAIASYSPVELISVEATRNHASWDGGFAFVGVTDDAVVPVTLTLVESDIHDNSAEVDGGALSVRGATVTADALTTFQANSASQDAGAVRLETTQTVPILWDGGTFTNNVAGRLGGAFGVSGRDGLTTVTNVAVDQNVSGEDGGGAWISAGLGGVVLSDATFTSNVARGDGGGLVLTNFGLDPNPIALLVERVELADNLAVHGGGAMLLGAPIELTDGDVSNNGASESGGALYIGDRAMVVVTTSDFADDTPNEVVLEVGPSLYTPPAGTTSFVCDGAAGVCF